MKKDLSFSPSTGPNKFGLFKDLNKCICSLTLKRHYAKLCIPKIPNGNLTSEVTNDKVTPHSQDEILQVLEDLWAEGNIESQTQCPFLEPDIEHTSFKPPSIFNPTQSKGPHIETFYQAVYKDFIQLCDAPAKKRSCNLSTAEHQVLKDLTTNKDIIVKQADKGGNLVVQDKSDYLREAYRLLADTNTYLKLPSSPLPQYQQELTILAEAAYREGVLNNKEKRFLLPKVCSTPYFYHLPKVHKFLVDPPGRPIVASTSSFTSGLSVYIDHLLQPMVCQLASYIKQSSHVIDILQDYSWHDGYLWASLDVASLYTSIPHEIGITAVQYFLNKNSGMNYRQSKFFMV